MITEYGDGRWIIRTSRWRNIKSAGVWDNQSPVNPVFESDSSNESEKTMWKCKQECVDFIRTQLENFNGTSRGQRVELDTGFEEESHTFLQLHPFKPDVVLLRVPHSKKIIEMGVDNVIWERKEKEE